LKGNMQFSRQQEQALAAIRNWMASDKQVFYLAGYAGTGKTTLANEVGADYFAAYTGKAAHVLQEKGCRNATTIHRLIYIPRIKSRQILKDLLQRAEKEPDNAKLMERILAEKNNLRKPAFILNLDSPLYGARLICIDECSMVNQQIGEDLLSFGTKVLVLGDPAQLPPVYGAGYFTEQKPDFLLTEVHRQAAGNPILDLATTIRTEHRLPLDHSLVVPKVTPEMALAVDQLIVGRNTTRHNANRRMRELLGHEGELPIAGDKLVCLRNNHDIGLLNGAVHMLESVQDTGEVLWVTLDNGLVVDAHKHPFLGQEIPFWMEGEAEKFEYGYALTCHKSQGSQWDSVGIIDESAAFRKDRWRWLYTAVTRAAKELWVAA